MKKDKLYNLIFPIYIVWLLPPIFLVIAVLDLIIDSLVVLITSKLLKLNKIFDIYKKTIFKIWSLGFVADFIGAVFLFIMSFIFNSIETKTNLEIRYNIDYDPFGNIYAFITTIIAVGISGALIFLFNNYIVFKKINISKKEKFVLSLSMAIFTMPYIFLCRILGDIQ